MDRELLNLLKSISRGSIRDTERVREILKTAKVKIEQTRQRVWNAESLLLSAEQAFLKGWSSDQPSDVH
jgi:hypothetical protein